jgi:hypothetical protein
MKRLSYKKLYYIFKYLNNPPSTKNLGKNTTYKYQLHDIGITEGEINRMADLIEQWRIKT